MDDEAAVCGIESWGWRFGLLSHVPCRRYYIQEARARILQHGEKQCENEIKGKRKERIQVFQLESFKIFRRV